MKSKIDKLISNTPRELKNADIWLLWKKTPKVETVNGQEVVKRDKNGNVEYGKEPYNAITGKKTDYTKKENCTSFKNAIEMLELNHGYYDGIGFSLFADDDFLFIDIDNKHNEMTTWKNDNPDDNIVTYFMSVTNSYAEISQSGNGLHIIAKGKKPEGMKCNNKNEGLEIYDHTRFLAFTGDIFENRKELQAIDDNTIKEIGKKYNLLKSSTTNTGGKNHVANDIKPLTLDANEIQKRLMNIWRSRGDEAELNHLLTVGHHDTFKDGDKSRQDFIILYDLAVITRRNVELMRSFFINHTALNREKTERLTGGIPYLDYTINNVLNCYDENRANYQQNTGNTTGGNNNKPYKHYSWSSKGLMEKILDSGELKPYKFVTFDNKKKNDWYKFINGIYVKQEENEVRQIIGQFEKERLQEPTPFREDMTQEERDKLLKAHNTYKKKLEEPQIRDNVEKLLKDEKDIIISSKKFDVDDSLLNASNCVIRLDDTGAEFLPHDEKMLFFKQLGAEYNTKGEPTKWLNFLKQAFKTDEELDYIRRVVGYCLTASTAEQCFFILLGHGRDGKGVFLNILLKLFGDYGKNAQATTFTGTGGQNNSHSDDFARLEGARLITINELKRNDTLDDQRIKQFTAGDYVTASEKYEKNKEFKPIGKIIMATNYFPHINSEDEGIFRRIRVIPWNVPEVTEESKILNLEAELTEELPLILNWALAGYVDYISYTKKTGSKLREPARFKEIKDEYRKEKDIVGQFLEERTTIEEGSFITIKDLYESFVSWAKAEGVYNDKTDTKQAFNEILVKKGFIKKRRSTAWGWLDIELHHNINENLDNILKFNK